MDEIPVLVRVPVQSTWVYGTRINVYTDRGTGTIDTSRALNRTPIKVFGESPDPLGGVGDGAAGKVPIGSAQPKAKGDGELGHWEFGEDPNGLAAGTGYVEVVCWIDQIVGDVKFGALAVDAAGNPQGGAMVEWTQYVSGDRPAPLTTFAFSQYDEANDQVEFAVA